MLAACSSWCSSTKTELFFPVAVVESAGYSASRVVRRALGARSKVPGFKRMSHRAPTPSMSPYFLSITMSLRLRGPLNRMTKCLSKI